MAPKPGSPISRSVPQVTIAAAFSVFAMLRGDEPLSETAPRGSPVRND
jgi:hypothetical protein